jgi:hypothetical protein
MSSLKRHFTAVIGKKEQGSYSSSSPSSAARKAVSKLCADDKKRKVEFYMRETTQSSEKKVYGPYTGYIEKLKEPIELKGRVIRYKPVAKLLKNKKMKGGKFNVFYYMFTNSQNGNRYKKQLTEKFKGKFTPDNRGSTNNGSANATTHNKIEAAKKNMSGKFKISAYGVTIADNYPDFKIVQAEIIKAFDDLKIAFEHIPEQNIDEINE